MIDWYSLLVWFYLILVIASTAWLLGKSADRDE